MGESVNVQFSGMSSKHNQNLKIINLNANPIGNEGLNLIK